MISAELQFRLEKVRLFLCDVDGILTDATVILGEGKEYKSFHIQDGLGLLILMRNGVQVGWVSNRHSEATRQRAEELKIQYLLQPKGSKVAAIETLLSETGISWDQVCYLGDDVVDLGALKRAGAAVAVPDAIEEVKAIAHYTTQARGGHGAVREVVRLILVAQNKWSKIVEDYSA